MNSSSNLLVLGVTGQVGQLVARNLKRRNAQFSVGTRRKAHLEELAAHFGASRFIDLDDPRTFDEALKNITGLFLISGYTVDMLVQSKSLIDAAKRNGVNHIAHLGAFTRDHDAYSTVFAWHQMIETYLRDSGVAWTNLHPNMFMQNFLSVWSIKGGVYNAYTSKAVGFTALEDVAEAAAVILMEGPEQHNGKDYWFSADVLTPRQVADTLTDATGRQFTAAVQNAGGFTNHAVQPGSAFETAYAKGGFELFEQVEHGRMAYVGSVIDDTKKLLDREPLLLRDWAKLHANELLECAGKGESMNIGVIGTGDIGEVIIRRLRDAGYPVKMANSRGPESLRGLAAKTGAIPVSVEQVVQDVDILFIVVPEKAIPGLPKGLLNRARKETIVIDVGNYYPYRDGRIDEL